MKSASSLLPGILKSGTILIFGAMPVFGSPSLPLRIDHFELSGGYLSASTTTPAVQEFTADPSILELERDLRVECTAGSIAASSFEGILSGSFTRVSRGRIRVAWDGSDQSFVDPAASGGTRSLGLGLNCAALQINGVRLVFRSADVALPLQLKITTGASGTHSTPLTGSGSFKIPTGGGTVYIPFSACLEGVGTANLADLRGVELAVSYEATSSLSRLGFGLDRVELVGAFSPPTALVAEVTSYPFVSLSWKDTGNAVSYELKRNGMLLGTSFRSAFTDNSTRSLKGQVLSYEARSVANDGTRSDWSVAANVRIVENPLFKYQALDLGALTGLGSNLRVVDIDRNGRISANLYSNGKPVSPLFLEVQPNLSYTIAYLPKPTGATEASVSSLNSQGQAVGYVILPTGPNGASEKQACLWTVAGYKLLGFLHDSPLTIGTFSYPAGSTANAINDSGLVVGGSFTVEDGTYRSHPFLWQAPNGPMQRLDETSLSPLVTEGVAQINNSGEISGLASRPPGAGSYAIRYSGAGVLSAPFSALAGWDVWGQVPLNNSGHVAAGLFVKNDPDIAYQTHLVSGFDPRALPMLAALDGRLSTRSTPSSINDSGVVAGSAGFFETEVYGFLFFDGITYPITELLHTTSSPLRTYHNIVKVNSSGLGLLTSWSENNINLVPHSYLLRPVLEPGTIEEWCSLHYGTPYVSASSLENDLDKNGIPDLLDYALASPIRSEISHSGELFWSFSRFSSRSEVWLTLQRSLDLVTWENVASISDGAWNIFSPGLLLETSPDPTVPGVEKVNIRNISNDGLNRYFIRIRATNAEPLN